MWKSSHFVLTTFKFFGYARYGAIYCIRNALKTLIYNPISAVSATSEDAGLTGHTVITKQKLEEDFPESRRMSTESLSSQDSNDSRVSYLMYQKIPSDFFELLCEPHFVSE